MLADLLALEVFDLFLVFCRVGSTIMLLPGIGAPYVATRFRLGLALAVSIVMLPALGPVLPPPPESTPETLILIVGEITVGVVIGLFIQLLMSALHLAGTVIGFVSGMANALVFDPISEQQGAMVIGILGNIAVLLIFATDLHHLIFHAIADSYTLMSPGQPLLTGDIIASSTRLVDRAFVVGVQLSAPFIVGSIFFQAGLGLMSRLMPAMSVFFVALPIQLLLSLALFALLIPPAMLVFLNFLRDGLMTFALPG